MPRPYPADRTREFDQWGADAVFRRLGCVVALRARKGNSVVGKRMVASGPKANIDDALDLAVDYCHGVDFGEWEVDRVEGGDPLGLSAVRSSVIQPRSTATIMARSALE